MAERGNGREGRKRGEQGRCGGGERQGAAAAPAAATAAAAKQQSQQQAAATTAAASSRAQALHCKLASCSTHLLVLPDGGGEHHLLPRLPPPDRILQLDGRRPRIGCLHVHASVGWRGSGERGSEELGGQALGGRCSLAVAQGRRSRLAISARDGRQKRAGARVPARGASTWAQTACRAGPAARLSAPTAPAGRGRRGRQPREEQQPGRAEPSRNGAALAARSTAALASLPCATPHSQHHAPSLAPPTMLSASMPACGWKVSVRREARRQLGPPARRAPATRMDPTSRCMSSSARMSCRAGVERCGVSQDRAMSAGGGLRARPTAHGRARAGHGQALQRSRAGQPCAARL